MTEKSTQHIKIQFEINWLASVISGIGLAGKKGMKQARAAKSFVKELLERISLPRELGPNEIHVVNVHAQYGTYQIIIGASHKKERSVEINGELHHLYVFPSQVRAIPTSQQVRDNLKGCMILRHLVLHLKDPKGDGVHLEPEKIRNSIFCKDTINLTEDEAPAWMKEMQETGRLAISTYRIVQEDILKTLSQKNS